VARDRRRATQPKIVAIEKVQAQQVTLPQKDNELRLSVAPEDLKTELQANGVVVHLHGHAEYKGKYWLLRKRGKGRKVLAQGTPQKLAELCKGLGFDLCLDHRKVGCDEHESID